MLWQRKQGKNRDFVKEFSIGPSPFLGDYPTFPSGVVTRSLVFSYLIVLQAYHLFSHIQWMTMHFSWVAVPLVYFLRECEFEGILYLI